MDKLKSLINPGKAEVDELLYDTGKPQKDASPAEKEHRSSAGQQALEPSTANTGSRVAGQNSDVAHQTGLKGEQSHLITTTGSSSAIEPSSLSSGTTERGETGKSQILTKKPIDSQTGVTGSRELERDEANRTGPTTLSTAIQQGSSQTLGASPLGESRTGAEEHLSPASPVGSQHNDGKSKVFQHRNVPESEKSVQASEGHTPISLVAAPVFSSGSTFHGTHEQKDDILNNRQASNDVSPLLQASGIASSQPTQPRYPTQSVPEALHGHIGTVIDKPSPATGENTHGKSMVGSLGYTGIAPTAASSVTPAANQRSIVDRSSNSSALSQDRENGLSHHVYNNVIGANKDHLHSNSLKPKAEEKPGALSGINSEVSSGHDTSSMSRASDAAVATTVAAHRHDHSQDQLTHHQHNSIIGKGSVDHSHETAEPKAHVLHSHLGDQGMTKSGASDRPLGSTSIAADKPAQKDRHIQTIASISASSAQHATERHSDVSSTRPVVLEQGHSIQHEQHKHLEHHGDTNHKPNKGGVLSNLMHRNDRDYDERSMSSSSVEDKHTPDKKHSSVVAAVAGIFKPKDKGHGTENIEDTHGTNHGEDKHESKVSKVLDKIIHPFSKSDKEHHSTSSINEPIAQHETRRRDPATATSPYPTPATLNAPITKTNDLHSSNILKFNDPTVEPNSEKLGNASIQHSSVAPLSSTESATKTNGPHSSNLLNVIDPTVTPNLNQHGTISRQDVHDTHGLPAKHDTSHVNSAAIAGSTGPATKTQGPHTSNILNVIDPRVKPNFEQRGTTSPGYDHDSPTQTAKHETSDRDLTTGTTSNAILAESTRPATKTQGPHTSNILNVIDPRVKPNLEHHETASNQYNHDSPAQIAKHETSHGGLTTGTTSNAVSAGSTGPATKTQGPHTSNILNVIDPRVKPNFEQHGTVSSRQSHDTFALGAEHETSHSNPGPGVASHTLPVRSTGPASNTQGPHSSNILNILDPRVQPSFEQQREHKLERMAVADVQAQTEHLENPSSIKTAVDQKNNSDHASHNPTGSTISSVTKPAVDTSGSGATTHSDVEPLHVQSDNKASVLEEPTHSTIGSMIGSTILGTEDTTSSAAKFTKDVSTEPGVHTASRGNPYTVKPVDPRVTMPDSS